MEANELIEALRDLVKPAWQEVYTKRIEEKKTNFKIADEYFGDGRLTLRAIFNHEENIGRITIRVLGYSLSYGKSATITDFAMLDTNYVNVIDRAIEEWLEARITWDSVMSENPDVIKYHAEIEEKRRFMF